MYRSSIRQGNAPVSAVRTLPLILRVPRNYTSVFHNDKAETGRVLNDPRLVCPAHQRPQPDFSADLIPPLADGAPWLCVPVMLAPAHAVQDERSALDFKLCLDITNWDVLGPVELRSKQRCCVARRVRGTVRIQRRSAGGDAVRAVDRRGRDNDSAAGIIVAYGEGPVRSCRVVQPCPGCCVRALRDGGLVGEDGHHVACAVGPGHGDEHPLGGELRPDCATAED